MSKKRGHRVFAIPLVAAFILAAMLSAGCGGGADTNSKIMETLDAWYSLKNAGDGASMWALLDSDSPTVSKMSRQFFVTSVAEEYSGGFTTTYEVKDIQIEKVKGTDWATAYLTVDVGEGVNLNGETVPPSRYDVTTDLVNRKGSWYVYEDRIEGPHND